VEDLLSEKEQIEIIRNWWTENGTYVIAGIVLGVGGIFGFNQWRSTQVETQLEASVLFENLAEEVEENRMEPAEAIATEIYAGFGETIYSDQARLAMARLYMDQGRDQDAADTLAAMLDNAANEEMQLIARLRLAKILLYQGKPEEVLELLEGYRETGFAARFNEALGDAHVALGQHQLAEQAYTFALDDPNAASTIDQNLLQMKINDLPDVLAEGDRVSTDPIDAAAGENAPPEVDDAIDDEVGDEVAEEAVE